VPRIVDHHQRRREVSAATLEEMLPLDERRKAMCEVFA